jgi:hypothetical protein
VTRPVPSLRTSRYYLTGCGCLAPDHHDTQTTSDGLALWRRHVEEVDGGTQRGGADHAVVVSMAAGADNIISAVPALNPYRVPINIGFAALLAAMNLRGVRESGRVDELRTLRRKPIEPNTTQPLRPGASVADHGRQPVEPFVGRFPRHHQIPGPDRNPPSVWERKVARECSTSLACLAVNRWQYRFTW